MGKLLKKAPNEGDSAGCLKDNGQSNQRTLQDLHRMIRLPARSVMDLVTTACAGRCNERAFLRFADGREED